MIGAVIGAALARVRTCRRPVHVGAAGAFVLALLMGLPGPGFFDVPLSHAAETAVAARHDIDPAVERGMATVHAEIVNHHTLITHRRLPKAMATSSAAKITAAVQSIRSGTTLSGAARVDLDALLDRIQHGAGLIGGSSDSLQQMDGLFAMTAALEEYGVRFAHPGWSPVQSR